MSYRALYRVWRPQRFEDLVGQEHVTQTLQNALREGHLSHAYLFNGPRGTGKTSAAKLLAKAVNCVHGPAAEPCNECEACKRITEGSIMDVVEIDAASNRGVDEIRDLRDKVKYAPTEVRYKVYIIDEVHMLTTEAFNALLKTLEEPPPHVIFILATTEPHKLLPTIISRCQRFSFRRISFEKIVERLKLICNTNQIYYEEQALFTLARTADGGMRDALSLLDQTIAFAGNQLTEQVVESVLGTVSRQIMFELIESILSQNQEKVIELIDQLIGEGSEPDRIIHDLLYTCRDVMLTQTAPKVAENQGVRLEAQGEQLTSKISTEQIEQWMDALIRDQAQMRHVSQPRIFLEVAIMKLMHIYRPVVEVAPTQVQELRRKVEQLEQLVDKVQRTGVIATNHDPSTETINPAPARSKSKSTPKKLSLHLIEQTTVAELKKVKQHWNDILQRVRSERITVHAWLIDGEPVAASEQVIILAFKTKIHCETTEKQPNKGIIEQAISQVLGRSYTIQTIMWSEWERVRPSPEAVSEISNSHPSRNQESSSAISMQDTTTSQGQDEVIEKALGIFGAELVEITED